MIKNKNIDFSFQEEDLWWRWKKCIYVNQTWENSWESKNWRKWNKLYKILRVTYIEFEKIL